MKSSLQTLAMLGGMLGVIAAPTAADADDWTIPGANCVASLGSGGPDGNQAFQASGGSTVAVCPLVKSGGSDNLANVWVRWKRGANTNSFINCSILAGNSLATVTDTAWQQAPAGAGPATLSLPIPEDVVSGGYISVMCVMASGDKLLGVRFIQN